MSVTLKVRRDTAANWTSVNPVLSSGEPGYETDTKKMKIGDGSTAWNSLSYFVSSSIDGWVDATLETWTYASATTFTVTGDKTAQYTPGTKIKLTQTTVKYFVVASSSVAGGTTTVTITGGSDYTLANAAISANYYGYSVNPQGWPGWFNFASATTGITGATEIARFKVEGRQVFIALNLSGTSNASTKTFTLPITPANVSGIQWITHVTVKNSGTIQATPGEVVVNPATLSTSIYKDTAAAAWTASGTWFAIGAGTYEI